MEPTMTAGQMSRNAHDRAGYRATLDDVARQAGVSRRTVSAVLNGSNSVRFSEETGRRVRRIVEKLDYRPNRTIASFRAGRHGAIGFLAKHSGEIGTSILYHLSLACAGRGLQLVLESFSSAEDLPLLLREDSVDSIVLWSDPPPRLAEALDRCRTPVIRVNTSRRFGPRCVAYDEEGACRAAAERFFACGRRHPIVLCDPRPYRHFSTQCRIDAFTEAAETLGMDRPLVAEAPWIDEPRLSRRTAEVLAFLREHPETDSVLLTHPFFTGPLYDAARRLDRRIPENLAVICFRAENFARMTSPTLASLDINEWRFPSLLFDILEEAADGTASDQGAVVPYEVAEGESLGPDDS
jgi:LacI family transcriptional regulator